MTKDKLVFFGTDAFSVPALIQLLAEQWEITAVVTRADSKSGRGQEITLPAVKRLAMAKGVPVLQPVKLSEIEDELRSLKPAAGIVVAYGKIISPAIMNLFPKGMINLHPSLLPKYRGPSPIESTILNADTDTGVTLMRLDEEMDTGPTYESVKLQLTGKETRPDLYEHLAEIGADLLSTRLTGILNGTLVPIPQDNARSSNSQMIKKADGNIVWTRPAEQLEREIRAYLGWPGSRGQIAGTEVTITAARAVPRNGQPGTAYRTPSGELAVYAGTGSVVIDTLKPAGKREMTGPEFLAGHKL